MLLCIRLNTKNKFTRTYSNSAFTVPVHSMKALLLDDKSPSKEVITLPESLFGVPVRKDILHRVVTWQLACKRAGTASSKTRAEKKGSGRKVYPQKGSGRARVGQIRSPMRRHGGHAHGPKPRDWSYHLPLKVQNLGLKCALSAKFAQKQLVIIDDTDLHSHKTRLLNSLFTKFGWTNSLIIEKSPAQPQIYLAHRNIPNINLLTYENINVYDILKHKYLLLHKEVIPVIDEAMKQLALSQKRRSRSGVVPNLLPFQKSHDEDDTVSEVSRKATVTGDLDEFYAKVIEGESHVKSTAQEQIEQREEEKGEQKGEQKPEQQGEKKEEQKPKKRGWFW